MKTKVRYLTILFACSMMVLIVSGGFALGAEKRPTISDAERAMAVIEVQNCMSKHAYYHQVGQHLEEMEDIWVKEDGAYAKTAHWGGYQGIELLKEYYGYYNLENKKKALEEISKVSEVENVPENIGAGNEYVIHMQTTPVIEIAGDGKTAKGIWYTPGIAIRVVIIDGKPEVSGTWMFEKYAVDFAKEDGKWKIWHFGNYGEPGPPGWGPTAQAAQAPPRDQALDAGVQTAASARPQPNNPNHGIPTQSWSPTLVPQIIPKFPEPYYTFSETFSY